MHIIYFKGLEAAKDIRQSVIATNVLVDYWRNDKTEFNPYSIWR